MNWVCPRSVEMGGTHEDQVLQRQEGTGNVVSMVTALVLTSNGLLHAHNARDISGRALGHGIVLR